MAALKPYIGLKGIKFTRIIGVEFLDKRYTHSDVVKSQYDNLAAYRRGKGGRASFSGVVATVFGCTGYLGRYIVNRLGKVGTQVICPYRCDPYYLKDLKIGGELGQILFLPFHLKDEESMRKAMKYSNVVINLVGRDWETKNFSFEDVHIDGARRLARIARESGVERFIHVSHLLAQPNPPTIYQKKPSKFLSSKYEGELVVKDEFPDATIFRPADIFGAEDRFLRYYANGWRRARGAMPLWKGGEQTIKRPVYFGDIAEGIVSAALDCSTAGKTYDCVGPHSYKLSELIDYFYRCMRFENFKRIYLSPLFLMKVKMMNYAPSNPILNVDKLEREHISDELHDQLTLEDLGVKLTPLESKTIYELKPYRSHSYYEESVGEYPDPAPPQQYVF
ncbi:hypothetical protein HELRODRAFT_98836 [Helobdella robusta]|uniref:NADH dehydrogenase [ubiquinone] 1 alpha subcomplex subunit 9, mitochondrial n=1 Tax=Helobdella robusta TaxID=6412 RepID=T1G9Q1_HELRO|nr:hypothetical protein HELRODRAFT_98836 [Helobdella robusta]ESO06944.1 hypothetical protein HELRODRAFT_98836 [Helobdella robusta]